MAKLAMQKLIGQNVPRSFTKLLEEKRPSVGSDRATKLQVVEEAPMRRNVHIAACESVRVLEEPHISKRKHAELLVSERQHVIRQSRKVSEFA